MFVFNKVCIIVSFVFLVQRYKDFLNFPNVFENILFVSYFAVVFVDLMFPVPLLIFFKRNRIS